MLPPQTSPCTTRGAPHPNHRNAPLLAKAIAHGGISRPEPRYWPTRAWPAGRSKARSRTWESACCARTGATHGPVTATSAESDSGSSRSSTPSKDSSGSNATAVAPAKGWAPASRNGCSPWPRRSGTTGTPTRPANAASSPTTTEHQLHGIDHLGRVRHPRPRRNRRAHETYAARRALLDLLVRQLPHGLVLMPMTTDFAVARAWMRDHTGAGVERRIRQTPHPHLPPQRRSAMAEDPHQAHRRIGWRVRLARTPRSSRPRPTRPTRPAAGRRTHRPSVACGPRQGRRLADTATAEHPWLATIPSSWFGQRPSKPIDYRPVVPDRVVELDVDQISSIAGGATKHDSSASERSWSDGPFATSM